MFHQGIIVSVCPEKHLVIKSHKKRLSYKCTSNLATRNKDIVISSVLEYTPSIFIYMVCPKSNLSNIDQVNRKI